MRTDSQLTFRIKRMAPLEEYTNQMAGRQQRLFVTKQDVSAGSSGGAQGAVTVAGAAVNSQAKSAKAQSSSEEDEDVLPWDSLDSVGSNSFDSDAYVASTTSSSSSSSSVVSGGSSIVDKIDGARTAEELKTLWLNLQGGTIPGYSLNIVLVNKIMSAALRLELPDLAIEIFEDTFGFYYEPDPAKSIMRLFEEGREDIVEQIGWTPALQSVRDDVKSLQPNNFVCTTAVKAYGRKSQSEEAMAVLPWLESRGVKVSLTLQHLS
jgi:hypothetical protein